MQTVKQNDESIVLNVNASMQAEGYKLSASALAACASVVSGKQSADQLIKALIAARTVNRDVTRK